MRLRPGERQERARRLNRGWFRDDHRRLRFHPIRNPRQLYAGPSLLLHQGTITGVTGANAGLSRTISDHLSGVVYFKKAFLFTVAVGDTFTLLPGCDHTTETCNATYQNLARFGGFPYIPPPELAV